MNVNRVWLKPALGRLAEMGWVLLLGAVALGTAVSPPAARGESLAADQPGSSANRSLLTIVAVDVKPAQPGPDTLCRLHVRLRNAGRDAASDLSFQISVNGQRLAPYLNHTFRSFVAPGKETDLPLFNFWSSEYGRPYPNDGRLVVEVRVTGARWVAAGSTNTGTLAGPVDPLPAPLSVTLTRATR